MSTTEIWAAKAIQKSFGASKALSSAHLSLRTGEIHALVGENGAGKSTLSKVAAGVYQIDEGTFELDGLPFIPTSIMSAAKSGIGLVFQEQSTSSSLTIAENIFINDLRRFRVGTLINRKKIEAAASTQLKSVGADFNVSTDMANLDVGQKKILEVARALAQNPRLIFMDEVTAFLDSRGRELVLKAMQNLKEQGITVCFVTHHMDEVFQIADRVTVMRDGKTIQTLKVGETDRSELERLMVGREVASHMYPPKEKKSASSETLLELSNISVGDRINGVTFSVAPGEVIGIAGLAGCGGNILLKAIGGDLPVKGGSMKCRDEDYSPKSPRDAIELGIAYLPGERDLEGLLSLFSVRENISLSILPSSFSSVSTATEAKISKQYVDDLKIKTHSIESQVDTLSGGNRQKVVLSKLLALNPKLLLLDNPTRGVDVGAREHIYQSITDAAHAGMAIILYSEDLPELLGLSDRILVLRHGGVSKEFRNVNKLAENDVITFML
jgi:ribose transport system ATP-binding protein